MKASSGPTTSQPPSSAPRRGRPPKTTTAQLSREAIREAALSVIDAGGVDAVTMRSVGGVLGVDAKSLYHYVDGKDDLLDAVAEYLLEQLRPPVATDSVADDLRAWAHEFRRITLAHPKAATLVLTRQLSSFAGLAPVEAALAVLARTGCGPEEAVHLMRTLLATLIGTLLREVSAGPTFGSADPGDIAERQRTLESAGLPQISLAAPYLARFDRDREFEYTIDLLIRLIAAED
ncbi:TetR/AcrR family transcriptional regulator C-terminal domain-containing protein [Nocardia sp. NPDC005825]|uniref:TetR/AcrR family transcriptional regulator n=1 Tax=unclassified Nocardia TaxID=2637762 RepID=UPI0033E12E47